MATPQTIEVIPKSKLEYQIKICDGFGITLSQFFSLEDETATLTADQKDCLALWRSLNARNKELASVYMKGLADGQEANKD